MPGTLSLWQQPQCRDGRNNGWKEEGREGISDQSGGKERGTISVQTLDICRESGSGPSSSSPQQWNGL
ncbi:unnamed protein product [Pleuronectes platessa]|uniref:Uncharacterized protein n=1 Tax=Pleuronectes platessa TaxID=8262 RepID=A0A9N7V4S4_PLEPL|nr:unnamed protein product [Pleuronectes platessa]